MRLPTASGVCWAVIVDLAVGSLVRRGIGWREVCIELLIIFTTYFLWYRVMP